MSEPCTVVIGATQHLKALKERAGDAGDVLAFSDTDALAALEAITTRRPQVVALERLFAATSRGAALINRIKADPALASAEIRIVAHDGAYSRVSPRRAAPVAAAPAAAETETAALDYRGTRRAPRFRMVEGTEGQIDGVPAKVIDLSLCGAQMISRNGLKPQQKVRITLTDEAGAIRLNATVAWAFFEIPKGVTQYRAGVELTDAQETAVAAFCKRHVKA